MKNKIKDNNKDKFVDNRIDQPGNLAQPGRAITKRKPGSTNSKPDFNNNFSFAQNDLLHLVIENLPDQIYLKDVDSRFILCNTPVARNAGYKSPEDIIGKTDFDFYPEAEQFFKDEQSVMKSAHPLINHEEQFIDKTTKKSRWNLTTKVPVKNNLGKVVGLLGINRDITQIKKALHEREEIMNNLIQRNKDLEQFTYIVSHNLRAPVANIMGLMELSDDLNASDADKQQVWAGITASIKNLNIIINDLNHILQVRKEIDGNKEIIYFERLVNDIQTSIISLITKEDMTIEYDFDEAPFIFSTPGYLFSIFYNLISNSIKYHRVGVNGSISIKSYAYSKFIKLIFKDNGKGIDLKRNGTQLFGLYKKFDTAAEGKGTGLFMVKTQVELLGGSIAVKSTLGKGTEFTIKLPKRKS